MTTQSNISALYGELNKFIHVSDYKQALKAANKSEWYLNTFVGQWIYMIFFICRVANRIVELELKISCSSSRHPNFFASAAPASKSVWLQIQNDLI